MGNHKGKAIMSVIDGNAKIQAKWDAMIEAMEARLYKEFQLGMGVPIPSAIQAQGRFISTRAQFATTADLSSYAKGASALLTDAFKEDWAGVALNAIDFISNVVTKILGSGVMTTAVTANSGIIEGVEKGTNKKVKFVVAIYTVNETCEASNWGTNETFYASKFVFVLWEPADMAKLTPQKIYKSKEVIAP